MANLPKTIKMNLIPALAVLLMLLLTACTGGDNPTPTPDQVAMVRLLATVGPTATLSPADLQATMAALPPTRTPAPLVPTATVTPYVGVFLGEAEIDPLEQVGDFAQADLLALPTQIGQPDTIPLLCPFLPLIRVSVHPGRTFPIYVRK